MIKHQVCSRCLMDTTAEDIYSQVFSGAVPQRVASGTPMGYGAAQASELTDLERDFPGMSTGDIIDSMNNRGPVATNIETAPQPKEAIYQDRIMNNNLPSYGYEPKQGILQGLQNKIGGLRDFLPFGDKSLSGLAVKGIKSLFERNPNSPSYQTRSPNIDYSNLNTTNLNDFYDSNEDSDTFGTNRFDRAVPGSFGSFRTLADYLNRNKTAVGKAAIAKEKQAIKAAKAQEISLAAAKAQQQAIINSFGTGASGQGGSRGDYGNPGGSSGEMTDANAGTYCFDPKTPIQMADGSTKEIKNIQLGDDTKGGEVTGVFQFKASDEIHDYKGVTVAGSHYVKEDGRFIMVKDSPLSVKIDKIPVVYSLDTSGRRIFIKDIEFADYNGDGVAKNFLNNAGVDLSGFDKEVLRQVEQRLL